MTMSEHPDVALPETMIKAAARAWLAFFRDDEQWDELQPWGQDNYLEAARLALAAALSVCEVREDWGTKVWIDGLGEADADNQWFDGDRGFAEDRVRLHAQRRAANPPEEDVTARRWFGNAQLVRRLAIRTPAEPVDTEGAAT